MNEKIITDHAEHCDFYVGNEHYDKSYEEQQRLWTLKFAELIVRECDRYVAEQYDVCEPWMEPGDLLRHFGVE